MVHNRPTSDNLPDVTHRGNNCGQAFYGFQNFSGPVNYTGEQSGTNQELHDAIVAKLNTSDPTTNYQEALNAHAEETSGWFLKSKEFLKWRDGSCRFFFLHGISGCGKTTLSAKIIHELKSYCKDHSSYIVGYYYFDSRKQHMHTQDATDFFKVLVKHVSHSLPSERAAIHKGLHCELSMLSLKEIFWKSMQNVGRMYIVIDALDECASHGKRDETLKIFRDLLQNEKVYFLVTSQDGESTDQITQFLEDPTKPISHECMKLSGDDLALDIEKVTNMKLTSSRWAEVASKHPEIIDKVRKKVTNVNSMFRLAVCQLEELSECVCKSVSELEDAINKLPDDIAGIYDRILNRIKSQEYNRVYMIFQWLLCSKRPLTLQEAEELTLLDNTGNNFSKGNSPAAPRVYLRNTFQSLIVITKDNFVRLSHYTVQEYLTNKKGDFYINMAKAHLQVASTCLSYIKFCDSQMEQHSECDNDYPRDRDIPLLQYSINYWYMHALIGSREINTKEICTTTGITMASTTLQSYLFTPILSMITRIWSRLAIFQQNRSIATANPESLASWAESMRTKLLTNQTELNEDVLRVAGCVGYLHLTTLILKHGAPVNADYQGIILIAAILGEYDILTMVLYGSQHGINYDTLFFRKICGLFIDHINTRNEAMQDDEKDEDKDDEKDEDKGDEKDEDKGGEKDEDKDDEKDEDKDDDDEDDEEEGGKGDDDDKHDLDKHNILYSGSDRSNSDMGRWWSPQKLHGVDTYSFPMVQLLLRHGADGDQRGIRYETALHYAAEAGCLRVLRLLINKGMDVNALAASSGQMLEKQPTVVGETALHWAAYTGQLSAVRMLLEAGANHTIKTQAGDTALHQAAAKGHIAVIRCLLDAGAGVHEQGHYSRPLLLQAVYSRSVTVVQLLLNHGAPVDLQANDGWGALHYSVYRGCEDIIQLLLNKNADYNAKTNNGTTVLHIAAYQGREDIVRLLLDKNADYNAKNNYGVTVLHTATYQGREGIVRLLLDKNADYNAKNNHGATVLHTAAYRGREGIVRLLLDKNADYNAKDNYGTTVLHTAASRGREDIVRLLLDKNADYNAQTNNGKTVLHLAAYRGREGIVRLLLDKNVNLDNPGDQQMSPLQAAVFGGSEAIMTLLLERHFKLDEIGNDGRTLLHYAAIGGHASMVRLLLSRGLAVSTRDKQGRQALHCAAASKSVETVIQLLNEDASQLKAQDKDGWTPLHWASKSGNTAVVELLLEQGCSLSDGSQEWGPLRLARLFGRKSLVSILMKVSTAVGETLQMQDRGDRHNSNCDGCELDIIGERFKCLKCLDFDFCFKCMWTADITHSNHTFKVVPAEK